MRTKSAFTLIEILISMTIVVLVASSVYAVFSQGLSLWKKRNVNKDFERKIRVSSEKIVRDLRNSFLFDNIPFEGAEKFVQFPSLISLKEKSPQEIPTKSQEVGCVSYFFDENQGTLCRNERNYREFFSDEKKDECTPVVSQLKDVRLSYAYLDEATGNYKWKDDWKKEDQDTIPKAVRIELIPKGDEKDAPAFSRLVFLPMGTGEQKKIFGTNTQ